MKTTLRRVKEGAYSVIASPATPRYYAWFDLDFIGAGSGIQASIYSDQGEWIEDRGAGPGPSVVSAVYGSPPHWTCIVGSAHVANGSLAVLTDDYTVAVWDVEADQVHSHTAAAGSIVTPPVYMAGWLYWWETQENYALGVEPAYALRRARADLTEISTIGTVTWPALEGGSSGVQELLGYQLSTAAARVDFQGSGRRNSRLTLAGAASTSEDIPNFLEYPTIARPDASGVAIGSLTGASGGIVNSEVRSVPVDTSTSSSARWPSTGAWQIGVLGSFGLSADRSVAVQLGGHTVVGGTATWVVEAPSAATSGEPTVSMQIHPHPDFGTEPPNALFPMV